jgi:hypothetical protein
VNGCLNLRQKDDVIFANLKGLKAGYALRNTDLIKAVTEIKNQMKIDQTITIKDCKDRNDKENLAYQRAYFHGFSGAIDKFLELLNRKGGKHG